MADYRQQFIEQMMPHAMEASRRTGVDPRIIIGQAAIESNYGKSAPGNNYFGIKSVGQQPGQVLATKEVGPQGEYSTTGKFRQFGGMEDSVKGYADFILNNQRYSKLREAQGLDAQLAELQKSGYATAPNYAQAVGGVARSLPLDGTVATAQPAAPAAPAAAPAATPAPAYASDIPTQLRLLANKVAPDTIEAPTALTPEQLAQQRASLLQEKEDEKTAQGFLQMAALGQPAQKPQQMLPPIQFQRRQFAGLPMPKGLL